MKRYLKAAAVALVSAATLCIAGPAVSHAENPIVQTSFTPDPAPVVFGDELWVYTGCDRDGQNGNYIMTGLRPRRSERQLHHDRLAGVLDQGYEELDRPRQIPQR